MEKKIISTGNSSANNENQDFRQKIGRGRKDPATGIIFELWYHDSVYYAAERGENRVRIRTWGTLEEARKGMRNTAKLGRICECSHALEEARKVMGKSARLDRLWEYARIAVARRRAAKFGINTTNNNL